MGNRIIFVKSDFGKKLIIQYLGSFPCLVASQQSQPSYDELGQNAAADGSELRTLYDDRPKKKKAMKCMNSGTLDSLYSRGQNLLFSKCFYCEKWAGFSDDIREMTEALGCVAKAMERDA